MLPGKAYCISFNFYAFYLLPKSNVYFKTVQAETIKNYQNFTFFYNRKAYRIDVFIGCLDGLMHFVSSEKYPTSCIY